MIHVQELGEAFAHLGLSVREAVQAMQDFNACMLRLPNGHVITYEQMEEAHEELRRVERAPLPFRKIRL